MGDFIGTLVFIVCILIATGNLTIKVPIHYDNGDCKTFQFDWEKSRLKDGCNDNS